MAISFPRWTNILPTIIPGVLEGFKGWYAQVHSLRADFRQTTFNPLWGENQEARGEFWFKKPGLMRWQYAMPQKDTIIINDEGLSWEEGLERVTPADIHVISRQLIEVMASEIAAKIVARLDEDIIYHLIKESIDGLVQRHAAEKSRKH